jgi:hypothetical protein
LSACAFLLFFTAFSAFAEGSVFLSPTRTTLVSLGAFATAAVSIVGTAAAGFASLGTTVS